MLLLRAELAQAALDGCELALALLDEVGGLDEALVELLTFRRDGVDVGFERLGLALDALELDAPALELLLGFLGGRRRLGERAAR